MLNALKIDPDLMPIIGYGRIVILLYILNGIKVIFRYMLI